MRYRSKTTDCEVMQWLDAPCEPVPGPEDIVAWVNTNGGEARLDDEPFNSDVLTGRWAPRIAIRTVDGWAYAAPGWYVVKGEAFFTVSRTRGGEGPMVPIRAFSPCDPETFERADWEPISE